MNEPNLEAQVQAREDVTAGDPGRIDTFADIREVTFGAIQIPDDVGYFALFSVGWRKGLVYDFSQLVPGAVRVPRNVPKALGAAFSYVLYQERFSLTEDEWEQLLAQRWFPFIGLTDESVLVMIKHLRAGWLIDELLPDIAEELHADLPKLRSQAAVSSVVAGHAAVVSSALDAFERGDWLTVSALLLPRLEGVLRSHYARLGRKGPTSKSLAETAVEDRSGRRHEHSLIFPARFKTYLEKTFFAWEDFSDPTAVEHVTRHSTAHGVAPENKLDRKQAVLSVLILRQLMLLLAI